MICGAFYDEEYFRTASKTRHMTIQEQYSSSNERDKSQSRWYMDGGGDVACMPAEYLNGPQRG
jgi:hypothetical protein